MLLYIHGANFYINAFYVTFMLQAIERYSLAQVDGCSNGGTLAEW